MQITINVKPRIIDADIIGRRFSHAVIFRRINEYSWWSRSTDDVIAYNVQKWRRKSTTILRAVKKKGKVTTVPTRVVVRPQTYWTANVYVFNEKVLKASGLKIVQNKHNFKLVNAKTGK